MQASGSVETQRKALSRTPAESQATGETTEKVPLLVELMGPAGAGKTSVLHALSKRHQGLRPGLGLSRFDKIPFFIRNTLSLLPTYLRYYRHSRWFDWRESRSLVYLQAGLHRLGRQPLEDVTVLDHGPLYRLATLREFGPPLSSDERFVRWYARLFRQWSATLDMIVWLDAPNEVLLQRIRDRDRWHLTKEESEPQANAFLCRYRAAMKQLMTDSVADREITLLLFDTSQQSVEEIADDVLGVINATQPR